MLEHQDDLNIKVKQSGMNFSEALYYIKRMFAVRRAGWNGKGMWLEMSEYDIGTMYKEFPLLPHILIKTADDFYVPWLASQNDLLAEDWELLHKID